MRMDEVVVVNSVALPWKAVTGTCKPWPTYGCAYGWAPGVENDDHIVYQPYNYSVSCMSSHVGAWELVAVLFDVGTQHVLKAI